MGKEDYSVRIRQIREDLALNQTDFAQNLGIPRSSLINYEKGGSIPSSFLDKLKTKFSVNIDWFMYGNGEMYSQEKTLENTSKPDESYKVPVLRQKVSCGLGQNWEAEQNIQDYVDLFTMIPQSMTGRLYALRVQGSSMLGAGIHEGDYVVFNSQANQILRDGNYIFALDGDVFCKRLEHDKLSKKLKIYSVRVSDLDKAELTMILTDDEAKERLHIFGRVIGWVHPDLDDE